MRMCMAVLSFLFATMVLSVGATIEKKTKARFAADVVLPSSITMTIRQSKPGFLDSLSLARQKNEQQNHQDVLPQVTFDRSFVADIAGSVEVSTQQLRANADATDAQLYEQRRLQISPVPSTASPVSAVPAPVPLTAVPSAAPSLGIPSTGFPVTPPPVSPVPLTAVPSTAPSLAMPSTGFPVTPPPVSSVPVPTAIPSISPTEEAAIVCYGPDPDGTLSCVAENAPAPGFILIWFGCPTAAESTVFDCTGGCTIFESDDLSLIGPDTPTCTGCTTCMETDFSVFGYDCTNYAPDSECAAANCDGICTNTLAPTMVPTGESTQQPTQAPSAPVTPPPSGPPTPTSQAATGFTIANRVSLLVITILSSVVMLIV